MDFKRRTFLKMTGNLAAGLVIAPMACKLDSNKEKETESKDSTTAAGPSATEAGTALTTFGLQLYTLRDELPKDPKGVLKQVASSW